MEKNFFGPAYNADKADAIISSIQGYDSPSASERPAEMKVKLQNHFADPVGTLVGGNPATGGALPPEKSVFRAMVEAVFGINTTHNCYGNAADIECLDYWPK